MTEIVQVDDSEGRTHWTAEGSPAHQQLLADIEAAADKPGDANSGEEVADHGTTEPAGTGDRADTEPADGGSDDGQASQLVDGDTGRSGTAQSRRRR